MSNFVLVSVGVPTPPTPPADVRSLWLESSDGSVAIPIASHGHAGPWVLQSSMTGAGVAPVNVDRGATPGIPGSFVEAVSVVERSMLLPLDLHTSTQAEQIAARDEMFALTDPSTGMFKLVCSSLSGAREVTLVYLSGFEGDESLKLPWFSRFVMQCVAPDPYARDREERSATFRIAGESVFLTTPGDTLNDWPRALASSTVIGEGMQIDMPSEVPVYPTIELVGPVDSFSIEADSGLSISSTLPVGAGQTLRIVTDPRSKSIRLDGAPAAGRIARGSRLAPFQVGTNVVDVAAPGATEDTTLTLTWRGGYRSLW